MDYTLFLQLVFDAFRALLWPVLGGVVTFVVVYQKQKSAEQEVSSLKQSVEKWKESVADLKTQVQELAVQSNTLLSLAQSMGEIKHEIAALKKQDKAFLAERTADTKFLFQEFTEKGTFLRSISEVKTLAGEIFGEMDKLNRAFSQHLGEHKRNG